jgi:hypothetical protein
MLSTVSAALFHLSNLLSKEMAEIMFALIQFDKQVFLNFTTKILLLFSESRGMA